MTTCVASLTENLVRKQMEFHHLRQIQMMFLFGLMTLEISNGFPRLHGAEAIPSIWQERWCGSLPMHIQGKWYWRIPMFFQGKIVLKLSKVLRDYMVLKFSDLLVKQGGAVAVQFSWKPWWCWRLSHVFAKIWLCWRFPIHLKGLTVVKISHASERLDGAEIFPCNWMDRWCWSFPMYLQGLRVLKFSHVLYMKGFMVLKL